MRGYKAVVRVCLPVLGLLLLRPAVRAQGGNFLHPIPEIERRLKYEPLEIFRMRGSRWEDDWTKRAILKWPDGVYMQVKWRRAPSGGWDENNEPRYEVAAYRLQTLFLEPAAYVVPPTVTRAWPVGRYRREVEKGVKPTFKNTQSVLFLLQYWLEQVGMENVFDKKRFDRDSTYAYHFANMNLLTHLIDHKDANIGNVLISTEPNNPRVFAVDNSMAFRSPESDRGTEWRRLKVNRLPAPTIERLRQLRKTDLEEALGVVEQYEIRDGQLVPVPPTQNLARDKGVRRQGNVIQLGLTQAEINDVYDRLQRLLKRVDQGRIKTFPFNWKGEESGEEKS